MIPINFSAEEDCSIQELGGFLKYVCPYKDNQSFQYKCHNSDMFYILDNEKIPLRGDVCSGDPYFYQACDKRLSGFKITNSAPALCNNYLCQNKNDKNESIILTLTRLREVGYICNGVNDCLDATNTTLKLDESKCRAEDKTRLLSGVEVETSKVCDDECDSENCEDEAVCNNFTYGLYCEYPAFRNNSALAYVPPRRICDETWDCKDYDDERDDCYQETLKNDTCIHHRQKKITAPVYNYTRCGVLGSTTFTAKIKI